MKKLLSIVLALAMVLTFMVPVFAEGTTVVYYVGDVQDGEAVAATAGATYVPDRMPQTTTPEGKYFAGWKDAQGNYVLDAGMVLAEGENRLYASYVDHVGKVSGTVVTNREDRVAMPGYDANGENFKLSVPGTRTDYMTFGQTTVDGETYSTITKTTGDWNYQPFIVTDGDGAAIQLQPGHTYKVSLTYKTTNSNQVVNNLAFGFGLNTSESYGLRNVFDSTVMQRYSCKTLITATSLSNIDDNALLNTRVNAGGYLGDDWIATLYSGGHRGYCPPVSGDWVTISFEGTVPADMTGYYPVLMASLRLGSTTLIVKEITIKDSEYVEPATVSYYIGEEQYGESVKATGKYVPDRVPTEVPEGKYFAGWKDENGKYVTTEGLELTEGENKLYASFVDHVGKVSGNIVSSNLAQVAYPNYDNNGENFLPSLYGARTNCYPIISYTYDGAVYPAIKGNAQWNYQHFMVTDGNGAALQLQPGHTYSITITYKNIKGSSTGSVNNLALAFGFSNSAGYRNNYDSNVVKNMAKVVLGATSCSADTSGLLNTSANSGGYREWIAILNNGGHYGYNLPDSSDTWITITFEGTMPADMTGYYPLLMGTLRLGADTMVFKEITVKDAAYKEPATVTYYVGEEQDGETVADLLEGETYTPDRIPSVAAPTGKYFAGWAYNGEIAESITLAAGENKLYAVYKDNIITNGGVAMLEGVAHNDVQALRYFFSYNTVNGNDIVIDGETYNIASRGFLLANANTIGDAEVTRETAAENSAIIDINTTNLTKCWTYADNGDGTTKLVFSTYITGFKPVDGTYNNTNKLYVKAYVVLEDGSVIYSEATAKTVADVANELGIVG